MHGARYGIRIGSIPVSSRGFASAAPNPHLIEYARLQARGASPLTILDIGCGAGRNAVPLALSGAHVIGTDLSLPMLRGRTLPHSIEPSATCACAHGEAASARSFDRSDHRARHLEPGAVGQPNSGRRSPKRRAAPRPAQHCSCLRSRVTRCRGVRRRLPGSRSSTRSSPASHRCSSPPSNCSSNFRPPDSNPIPTWPFRELFRPPPGQVRAGRRARDPRSGVSQDRRINVHDAFRLLKHCACSI